ncbi:MAG: PDDEXK nuclease domain-containing protein [Paludibacteraceae bacterium]|nr:PDDEXK nuclease domain-containing protein [Paludibacteraceae bacterium]
MEVSNSVIAEDNYKLFFDKITKQIRSAQYEAMKSVNTEMMNLYWQIGKELSEKQSQGWGKSVVETLSKDIQSEFPGIKGFGVRNLWYMVQFYTEYQSDEILQPLVAEISWAKHLAIMTKCKETQERRFYILATKRFGWTKDVLINKIELKSYENYLLGQTNFDVVLPENVKKQASLAVKDDYFVGYGELDTVHSEYDLEKSLVRNIQQFLAEFGPDVMFAGSQYRLEVSGKEYFVDLMLYHRRLKSFIAVELKVGEFEPEYKGKMEFYLNVINDTIKLPDENPAIGIIICKSKDRTIVEYALRSSNMPIGVATYSLSSNLPDHYVNMLPETSAIEENIMRLIGE